MTQQVLYCNNVDATLNNIIEGGNYNAVMVLVDTNTHKLVLPKLPCLRRAHIIEITPGDDNKNLDSLVHVWQLMHNAGATRKSLLVNVGGGSVTDLGGLAAATFKRGIAFINIPTTLLAAVDAAVGGKTGINFNGLKNEIGVFALATSVIVSTCFFHTLPPKELKSGYAEMIKHAMLRSQKHFFELLDFDLGKIDKNKLLELIRSSVKTKEDIVNQDPTEQGLRKALNLGHTVGHALESLAMEHGKPVPHGYAIAWGLVTEAVISHMTLGFPSDDLYILARFVHDNYGAPAVTCDHYDRLISFMQHDKKSSNGEINCTLLKKCGDFTIDNTIPPDTMKTALDILRDLMGV
ncbi:MAG: 3-dehydroquinate synthase [Muribaculaceae bacterium]|nr:3-dehydroquinate synthase [Muribaculaceae bacterium]